MATVAAGALNQIPFGVPDPPREFGQDGGRFYRLYDNLAEEIDDDLTKGLKEQLDGLLIFAGLFAGVNSAFLALTLPLLSADPADDTNALLAQNNAILMQLMQGRNDTSLGNSALPSTSFSPSHGIFTVNVLFSFSLSLAIISSFLAVLGRQWLVYYRKRSGGGPDRQRWEQLRRFLGAERWRLELVLDDILPSLLQIGLIIFCVSLVLYLHVLNPSISRIVGIPMCLGLAIFVLGALFTVWDRFCPFQSPLSHLFCWVTNHVLLWSARIWRIVWPKLLPIVPFILLALGLLAFYVGVLLLPVWLPFLGFAYLVGLPGSSISRDIVSAFSSCFGGLVGRRDNSPSQSQHNISGLLKRFFRSLFRGYFTVSTLRGPKNEVTFLQVVALKRAICTSDDPLTLLCATANIFTIDETRYLEGLWSDEMFHSRFLELCTNPYQRIVQLLGRDRIEAATSAARLYRGALCHIFLSLDPPNGYLVFEDPKVPEDIFQAIMSEPLVDPSWLIPPDMVYGCSPALIEAALASWMLRACVEYVPVERIGSHITEYSDSLSASDWKLVSLIIYILTRFPHSSDRVEIIQDGPRPFYSSPKRYDTVGSVMTAGLPLFTQPFTGQPVIVRQPAPQHEQQFIQTTGVPIYPIQPTGHIVGSPLYGVGTGHPIQQAIAAQPTGTLPAAGIQGQITGGPPQPIVFEGSVGDRFYVQGTGQTVPQAYTTGPNQLIYSGPHTGEGPYMAERVPTGQQPMFSPFRRFTGRSYTYPFQEVSVDVNDMFTRSLAPVLNIRELRSAYTRNVGMTLEALEEVAIDLARQQYAADLDSHRILLNILRCAREIIIDEGRYPNTGVRDRLGLLDIAEQVLRIEDIPVQVRATATMLRMDCVAMLRLRFMTGDARRKLPSDLLVLLGNFFFKLRTGGDSSQLSNEEDLLVLQLFGPLLRELYSYPTNVWKINDRYLWGSPVAQLKNLCDDVRQVYHQFRAKSDGQCNRDPEISWCHRREELDLDLPAQHFSERDPLSAQRFNLPEESAMIDDDSTHVRPIWHAGSRASSPIPIWMAPSPPAPRPRPLQGIVEESSLASSDDGQSSPIPIWMTAPPLQGIVEEDSPPLPLQPSLPLVVDSPPHLSDDGRSLASDSHGTVDRTV